MSPNDGIPEKLVSLNVIVAEDDPDDQYLFECALLDAYAGAKVDFVLTGNQLIQHLLRSVLSRGDGGADLPDMIIADLRRPFFWFEAVRELRIYTQFSQIPVFLFSMRASDELRKTAIRQGATALYDKPQTYHELRKLIREIARSLHRR